MKLDPQEQEIKTLYGSGQIIARKPDSKLLRQLKTTAENTFKKDRRINIRLSDHDMAGIQRVAASKGIPYQALIAGLIHQYIEGDLIET